MLLGEDEDRDEDVVVVVLWMLWDDECGTDWSLVGDEFVKEVEGNSDEYGWQILDGWDEENEDSDDNVAVVVASWLFLWDGDWSGELVGEEDLAEGSYKNDE